MSLLSLSTTSITLDKLSKRKGHVPEQFFCSLFDDHDCPGPHKVHVGMVLTAYRGSDAQAYRIVWVNNDQGTAFCAMSLTALHPNLDSEAFESRFRMKLSSTMFRRGKDGKYWESGPMYAGKRPALLGVAENNLDPDF